MSLSFENACAILYAKFGKHRAVADFLGMTQQHYSDLRRGYVKCPKRTHDYIILKAQEALRPADVPKMPDVVQA